MDLFHASCVMGELEKHTSCYKALEHLESSGTKAFMNGNVVLESCKRENRDGNKHDT